MIRILILLILFFELSLFSAENRLGSATIASIKQSLVYIKIPRHGTGSGFLFKTVGSIGYVVTNCHVVKEAIHNPRISIFAILASGLPNERSFIAKVKSYDLNKDLAILCIEGENLPTPFVFSTAEPEETMPVYIAGFPFGKDLSINGQNNPAPTITFSQISSLRMNAGGKIERLQTNGGMNPGNSGGPILDNEGMVLGVSVAKISGSEICFGIPSRDLKDIIAGQLTYGEAFFENNAKIIITAEAADPFENLSNITAIVMPLSEKSSEILFDQEGKIKASSGEKPIEMRLEYKNQTALGEIQTTSGDNKIKEILVQFRVCKKDGSAYYTIPRTSIVVDTTIKTRQSKPAKNIKKFPVELKQDAIKTKAQNPEPTAFPINFKALTIGQTWTGSGSIIEPIKQPGQVLNQNHDLNSWKNISISWDETGNAKGTFIGPIQRIGFLGETRQKEAGDFTPNHSYSFVITYNGISGPTGISILGSFDSAFLKFSGIAQVAGLGKGTVEFRRSDPSMPDGEYAGSWVCDLTNINKNLIDDSNKEFVISLPKYKTGLPQATLPKLAQIDVYPFRWIESSREMILAVEYKAKGSTTFIKGSIAGTFDEKKTAYTAWIKVGSILDSKVVLARPMLKDK